MFNTIEETLIEAVVSYSQQLWGKAQFKYGNGGQSQHRQLRWGIHPLAPSPCTLLHKPGTVTI